MSAMPSQMSVLLNSCELIRVNDTFRSAIAIESVDGAKIEDICVDGVVDRNTGNAIFIRDIRVPLRILFTTSIPVPYQVLQTAGWKVSLLKMWN